MEFFTRSLLPLVPTAYRLAVNEPLTFAHAQGACVQCVQGSVWVTFANEPLDTVLNAGERIV